jgi:hypothetical protein
MDFNIGLVKYNVECCNPDAIQYTDQKSMQKKFPGTIPGYQVGTNDKNEEPEERFQTGGDPIHRGNGHSQSEEGKLNNQFPVHKICFWMNNRCKRAY